MSCLDKFDRLCRKIVCPTRHDIDDQDMIDRKFRGCPPAYQLLDLKDNKGQTLSVLLFQNDDSYPTILYLHGNGGNKLEVLHLVKTAQDRHLNFCAFDFSGCGKSGGEFVTYGEQEVEDIHVVVKFLATSHRMGCLFLWGRSMGASLGLLYASKYQGVVRAIILDSPFRSLEKVVFNVASASQKVVPDFIVYIAVYFVKRKVQEIIGQEIFHIDYSTSFESLEKQKIPLLFAYSTRDNVVRQQDVMELYLQYQGPKRFSEFNCLHPEDRPKQFINESFQFLLRSLPSHSHLNQALSTQCSSRFNKTNTLSNPRQKWNS